MVCIYLINTRLCLYFFKNVTFRFVSNKKPFLKCVCMGMCEWERGGAFKAPFLAGLQQNVLFKK